MRNTRENILQSFSIEDFFENELKLRKRFLFLRTMILNAIAVFNPKM
jgi:hypothetical protein